MINSFKNQIGTQHAQRGEDAAIAHLWHRIAQRRPVPLLPSSYN